jgi:hypothetical protein
VAAVIDWAVPFTLTTPQGTLLLNQLDPVAGGYWILDKTGCSSSRLPRVTRDNLAEASGEIMHPHFTGGYEMTLKMLPFEDPDGKAACDELEQQMWDVLMLHVNAILGDNPLIAANGRIQWTPKGATVDRMLNPVRAILLPDETDEVLTVATFGLLSAYPYAWDAPETTSALADGVPSTLTNGGTASFAPVVKVYGPFTGDAFTLENGSVLDPNGNPLTVVYDGSLPGAPTIGVGDYIELTFFEEKAYKNGAGANAKPGIDITASDFFPLVPGPNVLTVTGATADVLWQNAYG